MADPALTPSGKLLATLLESDKDNGVLGLELAQAYQAEIKSFEYTDTDAAGFAMTDVSFAIKEIEAADVKDFDTFIRDYFAEAQQKKMPDIGQASKGSRETHILLEH